MFEWCSISLQTITSPGPQFAPPYEYATRLRASVALRTKMHSRRLRAFTKRATASRAPSYASVASAAIV